MASTRRIEENVSLDRAVYIVSLIDFSRYGGTPAVAIFASNHRYKRESYRGSEFAPRVLVDNGIPVVMKVSITCIYGKRTN